MQFDIQFNRCKIGAGMNIVKKPTVKQDELTAYLKQMLTKTEAEQFQPDIDFDEWLDAMFLLNSSIQKLERQK